jgi:hypothetical protein
MSNRGGNNGKTSGGNTGKMNDPNMQAFLKKNAKRIVQI